jgi:hypothetical protein
MSSLFASVRFVPVREGGRRPPNVGCLTVDVNAEMAAAVGKGKERERERKGKMKRSG